MRTLIAMCALIAGCNTMSPYDRELMAYREVLVAKYNAGALTREEANYLLVQKQNELRERRAGGQALHMGTALQGYAILEQNRPSPGPR